MGEKPARGLLVRVMCPNRDCRHGGTAQLLRLPVYEGTYVVGVPALYCSNCTSVVEITVPKWLVGDE